MDDVSDAGLVQRIAAGGRAGSVAEAALCERFALRVHLYGRKHLRAEEAARDMAQSVMLGVLEAARRGRIEDPQRLDRFVLGTCRNTVARMRQQAARVPLASESALAALSVAAIERVELSALFDCMNALEERARQVLMLSFLEEQPADEIARAQSLTPGHVRVIRHRAVAALRRCLDGESRP